MGPRGALQQAASRLRMAACPWRIRRHPTGNSPFVVVYETRRFAGQQPRGRSQAARGYRIENDRDVQQLVDLLLEADEDLRHGGPGLDWALLNLPPGLKPVGTSGRLQTWGQIRSLIKADIAPGGPKAKDRNPFARFSDQG